MAVVSITEQWRGRDASGGLDETTYSRVFRVWTDTATDGPDVVGAALEAAPYNLKPGKTYPTDPRAYCIASVPRNDLGPRGWLVTGRYSTKRERAELPENDPLRYSWGEEDFNRPVHRDRDGEAILNSAGDPPEGLVDEDSNRLVTVRGNIAATAAWIRQFKKSVNSDAFVIDGESVGVKYARVKKMTLGEWRYRGSNLMREFELQLSVRDADGLNWEDASKYADRGWNYLADDGSGGTIKSKATNPDNTDPNEPIFLDGSGGILANPTPSTVIYRDPKILRFKAFIGNLPGCVAP